MLATVPPRVPPVHCKTPPAKFNVAPLLPVPVNPDNWTAPEPEPANVPEKPPLRLTIPPVPALMIALLPPPVRARVPELLATVPEPLTGNQTVAVPEPVDRSRVPSLLKAVPPWPLLKRVAAAWKSKVAPCWLSIVVPSLPA
jgi:hypothetical protein